MNVQVMTRFATIALLALLPTAAIAQGFNQASFVYIECYDSSNARVSRGSGVLVSSDGRVLTAKHVIKSNSTCRASLGTGATAPSRSLVRGRASSAYDAMIVRLVPDPGEVFSTIRYTRIATLQGKSITAYGVPVDGTGQISVRRGVISTTVPDDAGHLETDTLTARGMSGGPVVLDETGALVGIVVGANLDVTNGLPTNYAVLAAQEVAVELELDPGGPVTPPKPRTRTLRPNWRNGSWFGIRSDADLKPINDATPAILAACASCVRLSDPVSSSHGVVSNEGQFITLDATTCKDGVRFLLASNRYYPPQPSALPGTIGGVGGDRQFDTVDVKAGEIVRIALDGSVNFTGWPRMCLAK